MDDIRQSAASELVQLSIILEAWKYYHSTEQTSVFPLSEKLMAYIQAIIIWIALMANPYGNPLPELIASLTWLVFGRFSAYRS